MVSGKLDEELLRLEKIIVGLEPSALVLMNESFSSTAEREGAAIADEVTGALYDLDIKVLFVTHFHEFARITEQSEKLEVRMFRAERLGDGRGTYVIQPGVSLPTSYGMDLFKEVIANDMFREVISR